MNKKIVISKIKTDKIFRHQVKSCFLRLKTLNLDFVSIAFFLNQPFSLSRKKSKMASRDKATNQLEDFKKSHQVSVNTNLLELDQNMFLSEHSSLLGLRSVENLLQILQLIQLVRVVNVQKTHPLVSMVPAIQYSQSLPTELLTCTST